MSAWGAPAAPKQAQPALLYNSARSLESLGRYDEATARYTRCAADAERAGVPPGHVFCVLGLASIAYEKGDLATAEKQLDAASPIIGPKVPDHFPPAPRFQTLKGSIALARGRLAEARTTLDALINSSKSVLTGEGNAVEARKANHAAVENLSHTVDATHPKLLLAQQLLDRFTSRDR